MIDMVGRKFHRMTVIKRADNSKAGRIMWECLCDCGKHKSVEGYHLRSGKIKSCGCYQRERTSEANFRNGGSIGYMRLPEYVVWCSIKDRCFNPSNKSYKNYGGRGITMCEAWKHDFKQFFLDMGKRPSQNYSIERIDVNKGYNPDNCKWIVSSRQARNKTNSHRIIIDGISFDLKALSETTGLDWDFLYYYLVLKTKKYGSKRTAERNDRDQI